MNMIHLKCDSNAHWKEVLKETGGYTKEEKKTPPMRMRQGEREREKNANISYGLTRARFITSEKVLHRDF